MSMSRLILLNKPFQVLSQFSPEGDKHTLKNYVDIPDVYPAGRLDYDSEGLLLLTDDGALQARIANPRFKMGKTYWVEVEGAITDEALSQLGAGVILKDGPTLPATAVRLHEPPLWPRNPPVRFRANIPTTWIALTIFEGRNRQVRRMTAAVGFPTLRLIRHSIGPWSVEDLQPGQWRAIEVTIDTLPAASPVLGQKKPRNPKTQQNVDNPPVTRRSRQSDSAMNQRDGKRNSPARKSDTHHKPAR